MSLWGRIVCAVTRKHKRGRLLKRAGIGTDGKTDTAVYGCNRCGATWTRKRKAKGAA